MHLFKRCYRTALRHTKKRYITIQIKTDVVWHTDLCTTGAKENRQRLCLLTAIGAKRSSDLTNVYRRAVEPLCSTYKKDYDQKSKSESLWTPKAPWGAFTNRALCCGPEIKTHVPWH